MTVLETQVTEILTQRTRAILYRDGLSYADILDCSASAASEFICPKQTSVYTPSAINNLTTSNRFAPITSTVPLMEGSLLEGCPPPRSEVSKHPHSSPFCQLHTKRIGQSRSIASSSRASNSSSQVVTGIRGQPRPS